MWTTADEVSAAADVCNVVSSVDFNNQPAHTKVLSFQSVDAD